MKPSSSFKAIEGENFYTLLGLTDKSRKYTEEELKRAYRKAVLRTHPDKAAEEEEEEGEGERDSSKSFLDVQRAWTVLSNPEERYRYDEQLLREEEEVDEVQADKEVSLEEMKEISGAGGLYGYECRCGDTFVLQQEEKPESGTSVLLPCCSCSLILCVNNSSHSK